MALSCQEIISMSKRIVSLNDIIYTNSFHLKVS